MKKYNKLDDKSYALGISLTLFLLEEKLKYVTKVYIHSAINKNDVYDKIINICLKNNIPVEQNNKVFNILTNKENCFVIGEFNKYDTYITNNNHIVLVNPSNAGNLGTIIRSMVGFGINDLAIISPAVDIYDPKVIRASMGSFFKLNFKYYNDFNEYKNEFHDHLIYTFMLQASKSLVKFEEKDKFSLVFGNEATGLPHEFLKIGEPLKIIHSNEIDSLNLPMAVTIALYEVTKRHFN